MGLIIDEILKQRGIKKKDFAKKLGINPVTLSKQINGDPRLTTLQKWADVLGVEINELFEQKIESNICPHCGEKISIKIRIEK